MPNNLSEFYLSIFLLLACKSEGQLNIGEKCPDITISNVINYTRPEFKVSEFEGKLVILDFWGTGCAGCIKDFSKMDSLQKKFSDKIRIIAVNSESKDSTERFFKKHKRIKIPDIPFATGDTNLMKLFPRNYVPWHVWIDGDRNVRYITHAQNATFENIRNFLDGKAPQLSHLKYIPDFDYNKPLFLQGNENFTSQILYYSYISPCMLGASISNSNGIIENGSIHLSRNCSSIIELYKIAFSENGKYNLKALNKVILELPDTYKYMWPKNDIDFDQWQQNYCYNYDLLLPESKASQLYKIMQQDLMRFFDLEGKIEKRRVESLVLMRTSKNDKLNSKAIIQTGAYSDSFRVFNKTFKGFYNSLSTILINNGYPAPLVDETNYKGKINISIDLNAIDPLDITALRRELRKYDLDLVKGSRVTDILILRKKK